MGLDHRAAQPAPPRLRAHVGSCELDDIEHYAKNGRDFSSWLDDVHLELDLHQSDLVAGSMGGWIAMNHAIYARHRVRRLALLGPMGLPSWRASLQVLGPMASLTLYPTETKKERLITRCLSAGERVNRDWRP